MYRLIATCFAAAATAAFATTTVLAQETGTVRGIVTLEENGDRVHGAVILVVGSGAFALTDEQGMFEIENVPAGSYEVLAQREHLTAGRQMVTVDPGATAILDFVLGLSPVHEDVTVTASVGGTETTFEAFNAVSTLDSFDIARESAGSLGDALQSEPGIASPQLRPRLEPAGHSWLRRRSGADPRGRAPHRRPVQPVRRPRRDDRPERRRADRDRTRTGDAALRVERGRRHRQRHHAARELS